MSTSTRTITHLGLVLATATLALSSAKAHAASGNICGELLQALTLPVTTEIRNCNSCGWLTPHCCLPEACMVSPDCFTISTTKKMVSLAAGTKYCDFSPKEAWDRFAADQISLSVDLLLPGLPDAFMAALDANIAALESVQSTLPGQTVQALKDLARPLCQSNNSSWCDNEANAVRVLRASVGNANWYLRGYDAVTVSDLVIMRNDHFDAIMNTSARSLSDMQSGKSRTLYMEAVESLTHELAHVAQFHRYGKNTYRTNYLLDMLFRGKGSTSEGYERSKYEKEAYGQEAKVSQSAGGLYCEFNAQSHIDQINKKGLSVTWNPCRSVREGSLDGDLNADLLFIEPSNNTVWAAFSNGSYAFINGSQWISPNSFGGGPQNYFVGDFNGDRIMDLGYFEAGDNSFHVMISTGTGFYGAGSGRWVEPGYFGHSAGRYLVGDFDGDGKDDLGFFEPGNTAFYVARSTGSGFDGGQVWSNPGMFGTNKDNFFVGDFDNDGRMDLGYFESGNNSFAVSLSTGKAFATGSIWVNSNWFGHSAGRYYVGDYDGDGKDDLGFFEPGNNTFYVARSLGNRFDTTGARVWVAQNMFGGNRDNFFPADFNADGKIDLGYFEAGDNSFHVALSEGTTFYIGSTWIPSGSFGHSGGRFMVTSVRRR
jgi:hypothetical protein